MNRFAKRTLDGLRFVYRALRPPKFSAVDLADPPVFPDGFLWGTATAAHQVEGGNRNNDWWAFERRRGLVRSGRATDHWNRVAADTRLMKQLGANAYRFSIEWSRVEPREGTWDEEAWDHYAREVRGLLANRIKPLVTLHHFTLPRWLGGGVLDERFPSLFARFAAEAARRFPEIELWCTLNEPNVLVFDGFVLGKWPPGEKCYGSASRAVEALLRAHAAASAAVRRVLPGAQIGVAMHLRVFDPGRRWLALDWIAAALLEESFNWSFYDSITSGRISFDVPGFPRLDKPHAPLLNSVQWFGLNYYTRDMVRFSLQEPSLAHRSAGPGPANDLDWEVYPEGLLRLLRATHARYHLPIYITENGIADREGQRRAVFIRSHAHAVSRALELGVPVRGYFHWSLMDNFEWEKGFKPRFGLYRVDYRNDLARTPAPGSEAFTELAPEAVRSRGARASSRSGRSPRGRSVASRRGNGAAQGTSPYDS